MDATNYTNLIPTRSDSLNSIEFDVERFGQVFTPALVAEFMVRGLKYQGRVLEPSCGDGAFLRALPKGFSTVAIEMDRRHCPDGAQNIDFFSYPTTEKFDSIIGNPPYVRYQDISPSTWSLLRQRAPENGPCLDIARAEPTFDERSNLYLFFIEKAIRHLKPGGELVFITPRDFMKATSAVQLNRWLYSLGTITNAVELGDAKVFDNAVPNCLVWRFEKSNFSRITYFASLGTGQSLAEKLSALCCQSRWDEEWEARQFVEHEGHLLFARNSYPYRLSDIASVKVGAVSGDDEIFADDVHGTTDFVCSKTAQTGQTRRMIWCPHGPVPALLPHKHRLVSRRIRAFDENNWWQWGRGFPQNHAPRVYVNAKTRNSAPFFLHPCNNFDGSVLAIFPHRHDIDLCHLRDALNALDWEELGFVCDGRFLFSQRSLENAPLPESFRVFIEPPSNLFCAAA